MFLELLSPVNITEPIKPWERVSLAHTFLFLSRQRRAKCASFTGGQEAQGSSSAPQLPLALNKGARKDRILFQLEHFWVGNRRRKIL